MNCNKNKSSALKEDEMILFVLGNQKNDSILSIVTMDTMTTHVFFEEDFPNVHLTNKKIITFNGTSYDLPLLQKNNFSLSKDNHLDLYHFFRQNIYADYKRYTMKSILEKNSLDFNLPSLKILTQYYTDDKEELKNALRSHINARLEIFKLMKQLIEEHCFSFKLFDEVQFLSLHRIQIKKDFLYLTLVTLNHIPIMEYHVDHAEIKSINSNTIIIRTALYTGTIDIKNTGKAIRTDYNELQDDNLSENFYLIEKNHDLLLEAVEKWINHLFNTL